MSIAKDNYFAYICVKCKFYSKTEYFRMPFKEGQQKTGGRQKGTANKATTAVRQLLKGKFEAYFNGGLFDADLAELEAKDRLDTMLKIAPFILPKLQSTSIDTSSDLNAVTISFNKKDNT